jgi:hypothetical protein
VQLADATDSVTHIHPHFAGVAAAGTDVKSTITAGCMKHPRANTGNRTTADGSVYRA